MRISPRGGLLVRSAATLVAGLVAVATAACSSAPLPVPADWPVYRSGEWSMRHPRGWILCVDTPTTVEVFSQTHLSAMAPLSCTNHNPSWPSDDGALVRIELVPASRVSERDGATEVEAPFPQDLVSLHSSQSCLGPRLPPDGGCAPGATIVESHVGYRIVLIGGHPYEIWVALGPMSSKQDEETARIIVGSIRPGTTGRSASPSGA